MPLLFDQKRPCNLGCIISTQSKGIGDSMWPQIQAAFSNPAIFVIMFRFIFLTPGCFELVRNSEEKENK